MATDTLRNLGVDATAGERCRVPMASSRLIATSAKTKCLQRLRAAVADLSVSHRSGPTTTSIRDGPVIIGGVALVPLPGLNA